MSGPGVNGLGIWLVICVVVAWLLWHPVGRAVLGAFVVALCIIALAGCSPSPEYECNISRISGTFTTTERDLESDSNHVHMKRGPRHFMWPRERITACRRID